MIGKKVEIQVPGKETQTVIILDKIGFPIPVGSGGAIGQKQMIIRDCYLSMNVDTNGIVIFLPEQIITLWGD